ncbi:EAL and HDOD domain-containing protein [Colwellia hornerae]|uniref:HDOD domain-containing protein n=1 Tax=Colwellia hornerae TaxID=89402 RepID=A0A5C6Q302_9GAMM|nr:HDOD domain-containing protein [Colwellia hornerae]TWX46542.1 HDOD domain-containing protein [Colwellia hornerae]TWX54290.1 HDOD domain-containing protein [Colwellia hornerae]TWX63067.1 HDOD domain-containing protein [Colwellia hornerae]
MEIVLNTFIARQAILDINLKTIGYELLFRDSLDNVFNESSLEKATSKVILQNHILGNLADVCFGKLAFINFDEFTLLQNSPLLFNPKDIVVEIIETVNISDKLVFNLAQLYKKGYVIALDDYDFASKWEVLFPYISIIKVDIEQVTYAQIEGLKKRLLSTNSHIKIIAERIETNKQYQQFKAIAIDYYQGYFFHKPEIKSGTCVSPLKINLIQLFLEAHKPHLDFNQLTVIISRDVTLVSGILKLVNSAAECGNIEITSIKQAITYLGTNKIKQYVAIISMSALSSESSPELFIESLVRAKMMELITEEKSFSHLKEKAFLTGILSNLDAILNLPMADVVKSFLFSSDIKLALSEQQGELSELLTLAKHYEVSTSKNVTRFVDRNKISEARLLNCYNEALKWGVNIF